MNKMHVPLLFPAPIGKLRAQKEVCEDIRYFRKCWGVFHFFSLKIEIVLIFDPLLLKIFITECRRGVKEKTCDFVFPKKV